MNVTDSFGGAVTAAYTAPASGANHTTVTFTIAATIAPQSDGRTYRVPFSFRVKTIPLVASAPVTFSFSAHDDSRTDLYTGDNDASVTLYYSPASASASSSDSSSVIIAIVCSIVGVLLIGLAAWRLGFFKRKEKPPMLDSQGNPQMADDD